MQRPLHADGVTALDLWGQHHVQVGDQLEVWVLLWGHLDEQPSDELDLRALEHAEVDEAVILVPAEWTELGG